MSTTSRLFGDPICSWNPRLDRLHLSGLESVAAIEDVAKATLSMAGTPAIEDVAKATLSMAGTTAIEGVA